METLEKPIKNKELEFVAMEVGKANKVIARGYDADKVVQKATASGKEFILSYIPAKNHTFIF